MRLAIAGKGGVGKTTVAGLLIRTLIENKKTPILAVDADPNANLNLILGVGFSKTIADLREEVRESTPQSFSRTDYFAMKLEEIISENNGFDLLVMGRPEGSGCYCSVNNLLREYLSKLSKNYPFVVIDCEAGLEHLSRRTTDNLDALILVAEPTRSSLRACGFSLEIAKRLHLKIKDIYLLLNKIRHNGNKDIKCEVEKLKIPLLAQIPYKEDLLLIAEQARNILKIELSKDITDIFNKILEKLF